MKYFRSSSVVRETFCFAFVLLCLGLQPVGFDFFYHLLYLVDFDYHFVFNKPHYIFGVAADRYLLLPYILGLPGIPPFYLVVFVSYLAWRVVITQRPDRIGFYYLAFMVGVLYFFVFWTPLSISCGFFLSGYLLYRRGFKHWWVLAVIGLLFHPFSLALFLVLCVFVAFNSLNDSAKVGLYGGVVFVCAVYVSGLIYQDLNQQHTNSPGGVFHSIPLYKAVGLSTQRDQEPDQQHANSPGVVIKPVPIYKKADVTTQYDQDLDQQHANSPDGIFHPVLIYKAAGLSMQLDQLVGDTAQQSPPIVRQSMRLGLSNATILLKKSKPFIAILLCFVLLWLSFRFDRAHAWGATACALLLILVVGLLGYKSWKNGSVLVSNVLIDQDAGLVDKSIDIAMRSVGMMPKKGVFLEDGIDKCFSVFDRFSPLKTGQGGVVRYCFENDIAEELYSRNEIERCISSKFFYDKYPKAEKIFYYRLSDGYVPFFNINVYMPNYSSVVNFLARRDCDS